ncbi:MAG: hypothetical protein HC830_15515 [Bacteroidetes bacterium]|nr:hypothetical protein [Bacteroidota bacterium]
MDYKIKGFRKNRLLVKNAGSLASPFSVSGVTGDSVIYEKWFPGFYGKKWVTLPDSATRLLAIDYKRNSIELYRNNNYYRTKGLFKSLEPVRFKLLTTLDDAKTSVIQYLPAVGWNTSNKFMAGILLHNGILLKKPLEYQLMPMYGFKGNKLAGMGKLSLNFFPDFAGIRILSVSLSGMQFAFDENKDYNKMKLEAKAVFRNNEFTIYPKHVLQPMQNA